MGRFDYLRMLVLLSFRNLFSHAIKSIIVGFILGGGTLLLVFFTAMLDSVEAAMSTSIIGSLAGHAQVYSSKARDDLALFGGGFMGAEDIGTIPDFAKVKATIEGVDNVDAVIPMGISSAVSTTGNEMDRVLTSLRDAVKSRDASRAEALKTQIRQILGLLDAEMELRREITSNTDKITGHLEDIAKARGDAFWAGFSADTETAITFLESRIAPITPDDRMVWLRYMGTDLKRFAAKFDRFEIVRGEMVPQGKRGFLLSEKYYERWLKNKVARDFDWLEKQIVDKGERIATDSTLQGRVKRMARQYRRITFDLDANESVTLDRKLRKLMPASKGDLNQLVKDFLMVNDENFSARYAFFYDHIAPMVQMHVVPVGEILTVRAYTKSGFVKSVNIKVWGTFRFKGIESSDFAGGTSLVDLMTFRDLYGQMTDDMREETAAIQAEIGLADVEQGDVEDALFGEDEGLVASGEEGAGFDEFEGVDLASVHAGGRGAQDRTFSPDALERGMALNAAIILKDPDRLEESIAEIQAAVDDAGLSLKVVDWQTAAGLIGQFISLLRGVLYLSVFVMFAVALVIINNSMIMATMERVTEIGTMRAIGAQRRFVLGMFIIETLVLGLTSGVIGAMLGAGLIRGLQSVGIPAPHEVVVFLFAGERLYPTVGAAHVATGVALIIVVSLVSTLYPAFIATRIEPVVAMQARE